LRVLLHDGPHTHLSYTHYHSLEPDRKGQEQKETSVVCEIVGFWTTCHTSSNHETHKGLLFALRVLQCRFRSLLHAFRRFEGCVGGRQNGF